MELTYREKLMKMLGSKHHLKSTERERPFFHVDCRFSKKKYCECNLFKPKFQDYEFNKLLAVLSSDAISFDLVENKIVYNPTISHEKEIEKVNHEIINSMSVRSRNSILKEFESYNLSNRDFKEVHKLIQDDKKICENCKVGLIENNYHKGWKNPETGDTVLLCSACAKKYFSGILETNTSTTSNYYSRREEQLAPTQTFTSSQNVNVSNRPFIAVSSSRPSFPNFQVIPQQTSSSSNPTFAISHMPTQGSSQQFIIKRPNEPELCCSLKKCGKSGRKCDFLNCRNCDKYYHPGCVGSHLVMKYVSKGRWLCEECKECKECGEKLNQGQSGVKKCYSCDETSHTTCIQKQIKDISGIYYYCSDCTECKNCGRMCSLPNQMNQNEMHFVKSYRVCDECWRSYKTQNYCPKCLKTYDSINQVNNVYCRKCLCYFHLECENITTEEFAQMAKTKYIYTCTICKEARNDRGLDQSNK